MRTPVVHTFPSSLYLASSLFFLLLQISITLFHLLSAGIRLRYYLPDLQKRGITKIGLVLNCESDAAKILADLVDLPCDIAGENDVVTLMFDPMGRAGNAFGVGTGWRPDDAEMSPYIKLFGMLFGLGVSNENRLCISFLSIRCFPMTLFFRSGLGNASCSHRWIHWQSASASAVD